ncbi:6138_t:CDS:1, partial [Funneliformis geosporum]
MWVLLEGDQSPFEIDVDQSFYTSEKFSLVRLKPILKDSFSELKDIRPTRIEFFNYDDRTTPLENGVILTEDTTT